MRLPPIFLTLVAALAAGCASRSPMQTVAHVDIERFMGDWFVIAHIPAFIEKTASDEVETYERRDDGAIQTTLRFRRGGFDGPVKRYQPVGFVHDDETNAEWRMQFIWPFKSEYLIVYLDDDYQTTVIARSKRDYVWVMSRSPRIPDDQYNRLLRFVEDLGYDRSKIRKVPQSDRTIAERFASS